MTVLLDFFRGLAVMPLVICSLVGIMYALNGFSWDIGSPYDHPAWIAGMFSWLPIVGLVAAVFWPR